MGQVAESVRAGCTTIRTTPTLADIAAQRALEKVVDSIQPGSISGVWVARCAFTVVHQALGVDAV